MPWFTIGGVALFVLVRLILVGRMHRLSGYAAAAREPQAKEEALESLDAIPWLLTGILIMLGVIADRIGGAS